MRLHTYRAFNFREWKTLNYESPDIKVTHRAKLTYALARVLDATALLREL